MSNMGLFTLWCLSMGVGMHNMVTYVLHLLVQPLLWFGLDTQLVIDEGIFTNIHEEVCN